MIRNGKEGRIYPVGKRGLDVMISGVLLILFIPLFGMISVAILVDSRGGAFFRQIRVGKNGKLFNFYKFRSMIRNAEMLRKTLRNQNEAEEPLFKIRRDPRITRVGRFLRATSLDELPQFWNVLRGDLSLVGPRPHLPEEVKAYSEAQQERLSVKPGITCRWQAENRSSTKFDEWIESDLEYIRNRSFRADLAILYRTFYTVLTRRNAV